MDPFESTTFELPGDEIEPVDDLAESGAVMEKEKIETYLIYGGLVAILRSNLSGRRNQPRVWLRPDSLGNVTHTFEEERGVVGGEVVPFQAVHHDRVLAPKREEVVSFLESFGLDLRDAEKVVSIVGTDP
jgi:hypothetical protein